MAERIVSGEYNGSVRRAVKSPTTASMGISIGAIQRQMRLIDPAAHAARLAERVRIAAEIAAGNAAGHVVEIVFVERAGSAPAKKALAKLTEKLKGMAISQRECVHLMFHFEGKGERETASLKAQLQQLIAEREQRAAERLLADEKSALVITELRARLEASEELADDAVSKATAIKEQARRNSDKLNHSLARAEKRFQDIQVANATSACASSSTNLLGGRGRGDGGRHRGDH